MAIRHEKLDLYRTAISYVAWVFEHSEKLNSVHHHTRGQRLRASQSIPLNIAKGNGKTAEADRRRYFEIGRGSAILHLLPATGRPAECKIQVQGETIRLSYACTGAMQ